MSIQYYLAQSLDGYLAETDGSLDWLTSYGGETEAEVSSVTEGSYDRFFAGVGALVMGSGTYGYLLDAGLERWPYPEMPSWVFTSRELDVPWEGADIRPASGDVGPVAEDAKAAAGDRNVWLVGGGELASQFAEAGLLDELLVTIVPVVLGDGIPTFAHRHVEPMKLTGTQAFASGMVELRYTLPGA